MLSDDAVRTAADHIWPLADLSSDGARDELLRDTRSGLEAFLRHHATDGREALLNEVFAIVCDDPTCDGHRDLAESIVTFLVGPRS